MLSDACMRYTHTHAPLGNLCINTATHTTYIHTRWGSEAYKIFICTCQRHEAPLKLSTHTHTDTLSLAGTHTSTHPCTHTHTLVAPKQMAKFRAEFYKFKVYLHMEECNEIYANFGMFNCCTQHSGLHTHIDTHTYVDI